MKTRGKPLAEGANRSKETRRNFSTKEQAAGKILEYLKTRSKPFERNQRISNEGAYRSEETREFRNRLESLKARGKPLERN